MRNIYIFLHSCTNAVQTSDPKKQIADALFDPKLEGNSGGTSWVEVWEDMQDGGGYGHRRPMLNTKIMIWARSSAIAQESTRGRRAACRSWHFVRGSREGVLRSGEQDMWACKGKSNVSWSWAQ